MLIRLGVFINLFFLYATILLRRLRLKHLCPAAFLLCSSCTDPAPLAPPEDAATLAARVAEGVNQLRREKGLPVLTRVVALDRVAEAYAREMVGNGHFAHEGAQGDHLEDRLERAGITNWNRAGENLALSRVTSNSTQYKIPVDAAGEAIRGWQLSSSHRENLYQREFTRCGVAAVRDPRRGEVYIVQIFLGGGK